MTADSAGSFRWSSSSRCIWRWRSSPWSSPHGRCSRAGARATACKTYCRWVIFTLRLLCGLQCEVRGTPPTAEAVIAAKHQSFLDIILIFNAVPAGKFIMKRELMYAPFLGQYALQDRLCSGGPRQAWGGHRQDEGRRRRWQLPTPAS